MATRRRACPSRPARRAPHHRDRRALAHGDAACARRRAGGCVDKVAAAVMLQTLARVEEGVTVRGDKPVGSAEIADWRDDPWDPVEQAPVADFEPLPRQRRWLRWVVYGTAALALGSDRRRRRRRPLVRVPGEPARRTGRDAQRRGRHGHECEPARRSTADRGDHHQRPRVPLLHQASTAALDLQPGYYTIRKHESMGRIAAILETAAVPDIHEGHVPRGLHAASHGEAPRGHRRRD